MEGLVNDQYTASSEKAPKVSSNCDSHKNYAVAKHNQSAQSPRDLDFPHILESSPNIKKIPTKWSVMLLVVIVYPR